MSPLFTLSYWTSLLPPPTFDPVFLRIAIAVFAVCILVGVVFIVFSRILREDVFWSKAAPKFAAMCLWMGTFGFLHLWIAYEQTYLWGARFWLLVWGVALIGWLARNMYYVFVSLPKIEKDDKEKMRILKYLPHKR